MEAKKQTTVTILAKPYTIESWRDSTDNQWRAESRLTLTGAAVPPGKTALAKNPAEVATIYKAHEPTEQKAIDNVRRQMELDLDRIDRARLREAKPSPAHSPAKR